MDSGWTQPKAGQWNSSKLVLRAQFSWAFNVDYILNLSATYRYNHC